ncbi:tetratricopeptide repeat protein [Azospirillum thermophilum]|uniref:tetratricopeptide repeat protein n=1 Tax=Azospirillum thermophilum TaxID=2202148 RepID=UPI001FEBB49C|nr:tetratricopeptide repeat protein [Azospirillum thermophilum]
MTSEASLRAAVALHRRTLATRPDDAAALAGLFDALDALGEPGRPEEAVARTNFGEALRRQGRVTEAEAHHRKALGWLPGFGGIHFNLGVVLQARGCSPRLPSAMARRRG